MKLFGNKNKEKYLMEAKQRQLEILSVEIALAGGEVLKNIFNFTDEQVALWLDGTLNQAIINRQKEQYNRDRVLANG